MKQTQTVTVDGVSVKVERQDNGLWFGVEANGLGWNYSLGVQPGCQTADEAAERLWAHVCANSER